MGQPQAGSAGRSHRLAAGSGSTRRPSGSRRSLLFGLTLAAASMALGPAAALGASATTDPATKVHHTTALLNGSLDPNGDPGILACDFEWGETEAYGETEPCNEGDAFGAPADVSANLGGLTPGTAYHFRLAVQTTSSGSLAGADRSFTPVPFPIIHPLIASFGADGTSESVFGNARGLGFDQIDRRLYVSDDDILYGFEASAPPAFATLSGFDPLATGSVEGGKLAVDDTALDSAGNVYLFRSGAFTGIGSRLYGFDSTGAPLGGNFPVDPALEPGPPEASPNGFRDGAVDSSGNVWVPDRETRKILKYSSDGVSQSALDVPEQSRPIAIASRILF